MKPAEWSFAAGIACVLVLALPSCTRLAGYHGRDIAALSQSHGLLKARHNNAAFELANDERILHVMAGSGVVLAPAGTYWLASWRIETRHNGEAWHIEGYGDSDEEPIEIRPGKTTVVRFGLPLRADVTVSEDKDDMEFGLRLTARDGRDFSSASIRRNGKRVEAPLVKILSAKGKTVAIGQFEYG